jgi:hypothetical protein
MSETAIELTQTDKELQRMLREPVAHSIIDSGMIYGYAHRINEKRGLHNEPEGTIRTTVISEEGDEYRSFTEVRGSTYHFLRSRLTWDEELNEKFREWRETWDGQPLSEFREPEEWLKSITVVEPDGTERPIEWHAHTTVNTANGDSLLDGVFQFSVVEVTDWFDDPDGDTIILLWIHGGCDVRMGYTDVGIFRANDLEGWYNLFDYDHGEISCESGNHYWATTNAGYTWDYHINRVATDEQPELIDTMVYHRPVYDDDRIDQIIVGKDGESRCPVCGDKLRFEMYP